MAEQQLTVTVTVRDEAGNQLRELNMGLDEFQDRIHGSEKGALEFGKGISRLGATAFIAYDRLSIAQQAVENAQTRQELSTMRLQHAIERYGAGSREATIAQQELEISTRGVEIAQQRFWVRTAMGVGVVLPNLIVGIKDTVKALGSLHLSNIMATISTEGLTRAQLALLAATGIGIPLAIAGAVAAGALDLGVFGAGKNETTNTTNIANIANTTNISNAAPPLAAAGMGTPLVVARAAGALDLGIFGGKNETTNTTNTTNVANTTNTSIYGDVNVPGVQEPTDFGRALAQSNAIQASRSANL